MSHEQNQRSQASGIQKSSDFDTDGMTSMLPPAMQLFASQSKPVQRQSTGKSIRDFSAKQTTASEAEIDATLEYAAFMSPKGAYQTELQMTTAEARLACLLLIEALHLEQDVDMEKQGMTFALKAQKRLKPEPDKGVIPRLGMEINEVSEERAQEIFDEMAQLTFFNKDGNEVPVPFHYPVDGCFVRAQLMAERLTAMGYVSQKQFVMNGNLEIETDLAKDCNPSVTWWYHVAPTINVSNKDGKVIQMVIDPSITSKPVSVSDWISLMSSQRFEYVTLADIRIIARSGRELRDFKGNVTYTTDRNNIVPQDLSDSISDEVALERMNRREFSIKTYTIKAEAHELAAMIRKNIKSGTKDIRNCISFVQGMSVNSRHDFDNNFKKLTAKLEGLANQDQYKRLIELIKKDRSKI